MVVLGQRASLTAGGLGSWSGCRDQKLRRSGAMTYLPSPLRGVGDGGCRPDGAGFDPGDDIFDFVVFEFAALRHLQGGSGLLDGADEQALFGVAGDDGGAGLAAFEHAVATIEPQAAQLRIAVAVVAVIG